MLLLHKNTYSKMQITQKNFKDSVSQFATGVTIVTTTIDNKPLGITINSFSSVSITPLLISFCLHKLSSIYEDFIKENHFSINILAHDQLELCQIFTKTYNVDWNLIDYKISDITNTPILNNISAFLECKKFKLVDAGDHTIIIGEVINCDISGKESLIYYNRKFGTMK
jgi:flavin reductase (DIM6/NTAB) family NADH-FMN oxidoreductase RutF